MSTSGRLEARMTIPAAGWAVSATNGTGGPTTVTVPAGDYYPTTLLTTFAAQLNASRPGTPAWTAAGSYGESGTGRVTIDGQAGWAIAWTSTNLRDALGFTANIGAPTVSTPQTGTNHAQGVWLPGCPMYHPLGAVADAGMQISDARYTRSPLGHVKAIASNIRTELAGVRWDAVPRAKARIAGESTVGESVERFWYQCHAGQLSYFPAGSHIALYLDADSATSKAYKCVGWQRCPGTPVVDGWTGLWRVETGSLILVP